MWEIQKFKHDRSIGLQFRSVSELAYGDISLEMIFNNVYPVYHIFPPFIYLLSNLHTNYVYPITEDTYI